MSSLFSAISAKIFGGLFLAALAFSVWTQLQLNGARDANTLLTAQLGKALADKALCSLSVETQKQLADARKREADAAMVAANKQTVVRTERANTILKEVPTADDQCVAALDLLRRYQ